jgi:hypothetical protein
MEATRAPLECEVKGREMDFKDSVSQSVTDPQRTASINGVTPTITARRRSHSSPAALSTTATSTPGTEHPSVDMLNAPSSIPAMSTGRQERVSQPENQTTHHAGVSGSPNLHAFHQLDNSFGPRVYNNVSELMLALVTCATVGFTIYFAYNSSLAIPQSPSLIFSRPQNTIVALNILAQVSMMLLGQLTNGSFDRLRWGLASTRTGVPALSFFALASSTTYTGVLMMLYHGLNTHNSTPTQKTRQWRLTRIDQRVWGSQR